MAAGRAAPSVAAIAATLKAVARREGAATVAVARAVEVRAAVEPEEAARVAAKEASSG